MWWKLSCLRATTVQVLEQLVLMKGIIERESVEVINSFIVAVAVAFSPTNKNPSEPS